MTRRTILDDIPASRLHDLQRRAYMAGAWHTLAWLIAFYEAKRGR